MTAIEHADPHPAELLAWSIRAMRNPDGPGLVRACEHCGERYPCPAKRAAHEHNPVTCPPGRCALDWA